MRDFKLFLMNRPKRFLFIFDIIILFITITSIVFIVILAIGMFKTFYAILISLILIIIIIFIFNIRIKLSDSRFDLGILVILLIAVIFRFQPYLFLAGGQDQGWYICMSKNFEENGTYDFRDQFRDELNPEQKSYYDKSNNGWFAGLVELGNSKYSACFYPLHPLWMATFGKIFGDENRVYSLLLFSLLSIIAFYFLAYEISNHNKYTAYLIGIFLAANPLHVFMSKYPCAEIVALAFMSLSIYYLVRYVKSLNEENGGLFNIIISILLFNCFLYTRISAFLYVPFYCFTAFIGILFINDKKIKKNLLIYLAILLIMFLISTFYYYIFIRPLYNMLLGFIAPLFRRYQQYWNIILIVLFLIYILFLLIINYINTLIKKEDWKKLIIRIFYFLISVIFIVTIVYNLFIFYNIGFTSNMADHRWEIGGNGFRDIRVMTLYNIGLYLSPIGILVLFYAFYYYRKKLKPVFLLLLSFITLFWFYNLLYSPYISYQFYYSRYLISEVIPYSLLLIALFLGDILLNNRQKFIRIVNYIFIILITGYFLFYSSFQFLGKESASQLFFYQLKKLVHTNDVLLYQEPYNFNYHIIGTPLKYYYNFNLVRLFDINGFDDMKIFSQGFDNVYILSLYKENDNEFRKYLGSFTYQFGYFFNGTHQHYQDNPIKPSKKSFQLPFYSAMIPSQYCEWERTYYLYQFNKKAQYKTNKLIVVRPGAVYPEQLVNYHDDNIWTKGDAIIKELNITLEKNYKFVAIHTYGWNPNKNNIKLLQLHFYINQKELKYKLFKNDTFYFTMHQ